MDPYQELANAIIIMASRDYMKAYKKYLRSGEGYGKVMKEESFFFTAWFNTLSDANPKYLVEAMRRKCEMQIEKEDEVDEADEDETDEADEGEEDEDEVEEEEVEEGEVDEPKDGEEEEDDC